MKDTSFIELSLTERNFLTRGMKYKTPSNVEEFSVIDIIINSTECFTIISNNPFFYKGHYSSRVVLGYPPINNSSIDLNPKLVWDGSKWLVSTFGYCFFPEIEFNHDFQI